MYGFKELRDLANLLKHSSTMSHVIIEFNWFKNLLFEFSMSTPSHRCMIDDTVQIIIKRSVQYINPLTKYSSTTIQLQTQTIPTTDGLN